MTGEPPPAQQQQQQQQRAAIELYVRSKWIQANLAIEDENLFIEYAHHKQEQINPTESANATETNDENPSNPTPDTITSQKRTIKIVKPDNTGLGNEQKRTKEEHFRFLFRDKYQRRERESNANFNQ